MGRRYAQNDMDEEAWEATEHPTLFFWILKRVLIAGFIIAMVGGILGWWEL